MLKLLRLSLAALLMLVLSPPTAIFAAGNPAIPVAPPASQYTVTGPAQFLVTGPTHHNPVVNHMATPGNTAFQTPGTGVSQTGGIYIDNHAVDTSSNGSIINNGTARSAYDSIQSNRTGLDDQTVLAWIAMNAARANTANDQTPAPCMEKKPVASIYTNDDRTIEVPCSVPNALTTSTSIIGGSIAYPIGNNGGPSPLINNGQTIFDVPSPMADRAASNTANNDCLSAIIRDITTCPSSPLTSNPNSLIDPMGQNNNSGMAYDYNRK